MEIYNDVGAANSVFGWGIFMFLYFGFILFSAGIMCTLVKTQNQEILVMNSFLDYAAFSAVA
ncbi:hypothetical protein [Petrocella atlantisensis]|uniref:hypothetical protein n=1 Tax=Petrocella atlantisensis TaxID=2173034 RepID=UPI000F63A9E2|nr:hypothetical protein [Petrocella atlantisensis]